VAVLLFCLSGGISSLARAVATERLPDSKTHASQPVSQAQDHSCCPRAHAPLVVPIEVGFLPDSIPCREHPCCVSHGPEVPATLLAASGMRQPGVRKAFGEETGIGIGPQFRFAHNTFSNAAFQPYFFSSMVLRI